MQFSGARLKAGTVREVCDARRVGFRQTANIIRTDIDSQIMDAASGGLNCAMIDIPKHYMGREGYDWVQMGRAIVDQLIADGFCVTGTYIRFRVSWDRSVNASAKSQPKKTTVITIPSYH